MSLLDVPERVLQHAVQRVMSESGRIRTCTNGDSIQILAPGVLNPHEGPDFDHTAILRNGTVVVGSTEFHARSSSWHHHGHATDVRYDDVILHVVLVDDVGRSDGVPVLVLPHDEVGKALRRGDPPDDATAVSVDEIQRGALMRLERTTAHARTVIRRIGPADAVRALTSSWFDRLRHKRHHPMHEDLVFDVRRSIAASPLGLLALRIQTVDPQEILDALIHAERERIGCEGASVRRELVVNVILPVAMAMAPLPARVPLLQWYWSTKAVGPYGPLVRRFPTIDQTYVWQQQGLLECVRIARGA